MSASAIEDGIRAILQRIAKLEPGWSAQADIFRELGVKSAAALDLLLSMEEEFGIQIGDDAFGEARTTEKLVALVATLKGEAA
jgi:acyl carrier protein